MLEGLRLVLQRVGLSKGYTSLYRSFSKGYTRLYRAFQSAIYDIWVFCIGFHRHDVDVHMFHVGFLRSYMVV